MTFSNAAMQAFDSALISAFPDQTSLARMVHYQLDENLESIVGEGKTEALVFELIKWAKAQGRLDDLINGARAVNSGNPALKAWLAAHDEQPGTANPIHLLPFSRNPNFAGRAKILADLHDGFPQGQTTIIVQAVSGLGGIGKTQLALEYAHKHLNDYDLIGWLHAEEDSTLAADYATLGQALGLKVTATEQQIVNTMVRQRLQSTDQSWLLIFDNAEKMETIQSYIPQTGSGHVLITSRNPSWGRMAKMTHRLDVFSTAEADDFMKHRISSDDSAREDIDRLATTLGHLPLALEQAAAYIEETGTTVDRYLVLFNEHRQALIDRTARPKDYSENVETVWSLSFEKIQADAPAAAQLLKLLTFFAPDNIPRALFSEHGAQLPPTLAQAVQGPFGFDDAMGALNRYSLVKRKGEMLSIHRLVQAVIGDRLSAEERAALGHAAANLMVAAFTFDRLALPTWEASRPLLTHALSVAEITAQMEITQEASAILWQQSGEYLRVQGEFTPAQNSIEQALQIRRTLFGEQAAPTAKSQDYLGELKQEQGHYAEAYTLHEQALAIQKVALGDNHPDTARTLNNIGSLYDTQADYSRALSYHEQSLAIRKTTLGDNHPDTANSLNNIATVYDAQGDYDRALSYYEQALSIKKATLGDNHPDTASSLNNIATVYQSQGDYDRALSYFEQALVILKATLGDNHPDTASSLNNIGYVYNAQGDYGRALSYFEQPLAITKATLGDNHPDTAGSLNNIASVHQSQGDYGRALSYYEQALAIQKTTLGDNHPDTAKSLNNIGTCHFHCNNRPLARRYLKRALPMLEHFLGPDHPDTITCRKNYSVVRIGRSTKSKKGKGPKSKGGKQNGKKKKRNRKSKG